MGDYMSYRNFVTGCARIARVVRPHETSELVELVVKKCYSKRVPEVVVD